jgi:multidrug efflux pump subunit AcrA (membrane-fusion protein)
VVLLALLGVLVGFGVSSIFGTSTASATSSRTATVGRGTVQLLETATGNVAPEESATLNFPISGTLSSLDVKVGEKVRAGTLLAAIDATQAADSVQQARAALLSARNTLATDESGPSAATKASQAAGVVGAEASVASAQQTLQSDQSALAQARSDLAELEALGCPETTGSSGGSSSSSAAGLSSGASGAGSTGVSSSTGSASSSGSSSSTGSLATGTGSGATSSSSTKSTSTPSSGSGLGVGSGGGTAAHTNAAAFVTGVSDQVATLTSATATAPPTVETTSASAGATTATLSGTLNPNGGDTAYRFDYGTTPAMGAQTPLESAGNATAPISVSATITGLRPNTVYVYRLVATNAQGTSAGTAFSFTTAESACANEQQVVTNDAQAMSRAAQSLSQAKDSLASTLASNAAANAPNEATIAQDEATIAQDEATLVQDETNLAQTTLRAPISGTVTAVNATVGQTVSAGTSTTTFASATTPSSSSSGVGLAGGNAGSSASAASSGTGVIVIEDLAHLSVVVDFPEADIGDLAVGQQATVTFPALTNVSAVGTVTEISPTSTISSSVVEYPVTIALGDPPPGVRDGMTADVSVVAKTASDVLEVPSQAVTTVGTSSTVTVLEHGKQVSVPVSVGIVGSSTTQITSGLKAGETVVLPAVSVSGAASSSAPGAGGFGGGLGGGFGARLFGG